LGIGDWGLGIGDWAQSPIPNPQSPIPNPQYQFIIIFFNFNYLDQFDNYLLVIYFYFIILDKNPLIPKTTISLKVSFIPSIKALSVSSSSSSSSFSGSGISFFFLSVSVE